MLYDRVALHPQQESGVCASVDARLIALDDEYATFHTCMIGHTPCLTIHDTLRNCQNAPLIHFTGTLCITVSCEAFQLLSTSRSPLRRYMRPRQDSASKL